MQLTGTASFTASARIINPTTEIFHRQENLSTQISRTRVDVEVTKSHNRHQASIRVKRGNTSTEFIARDIDTSKSRRTSELELTVSTSSEEQVYAD